MLQYSLTFRNEHGIIIEQRKGIQCPTREAWKNWLLEWVKENAEALEAGDTLTIHMETI